MKIRDLVLYILLLCVASAGLIASFFHKNGTYADIYAGGKLYGRYDLSAPCLIHIENDNGIVNDIEISDGEIYMKNATCPGRQCMKCGRISREHESICCAPAGIVIVIEPTEVSGLDAITK